MAETESAPYLGLPSDKSAILCRLYALAITVGAEIEAEQQEGIEKAPQGLAAVGGQMRAEERADVD
jgi:hypothetical protein